MAPCYHPPHARPRTRAAPTLTPEGEALVRRTRWERAGVRLTHPERCRGERQGNAKLTEADAWAILRHLAEGGVTRAALAREYGVAPSTIEWIERGVTWRHVERPEPGPGRANRPR